jgi:hypothetical protein
MSAVNLSTAEAKLMAAVFSQMDDIPQVSRSLDLAGDILKLLASLVPISLPLYFPLPFYLHVHLSFMHSYLSHILRSQQQLTASSSKFIIVFIFMKSTSSY